MKCSLTRYSSFAPSSQGRGASVHHQGVKGKFDLDRPQVNMAVMVNRAVMMNMAVTVMAVMTVTVALMVRILNLYDQRAWSCLCVSLQCYQKVDK